MDIKIFTSDPDAVGAGVDEIRAALEALGYFVGEIEIVDRGE